MRKWSFLVTALALALAQSSQAQMQTQGLTVGSPGPSSDGPGPKSPNAGSSGNQASISDLLSQGYEVKATSVVSAVDSKTAFKASEKPLALVLVTLQRGQSIAICQFTWVTWGTLASTNSAAYTQKDRCDAP